MAAPLTSEQRQKLAMLARRAFDLKQGQARAAGAMIDGQIFQNAFLNDFDEWRHQEVFRACEKDGLQLCSQDDYGRVRGHFLTLLGNEKEAAYWTQRDATNPRRVAWNKLTGALRDAGLHRGYAEKICQSQFKCALRDASEKQVWKLYFTIRNRKAAR